MIRTNSIKVGIVTTALILFFSVVGYTENYEIFFPREFYSEIRYWTIQDAQSCLGKWLGTEPSEIIENRIIYNSPSSKNIQFTQIDYFSSSDSNTISIEILRPFGEIVSESQFYIDLVNHFQSIYGEGTISGYFMGDPILRWQDKENSIILSINYESGDTKMGISPTISIVFYAYFPDKET